LALALAVLAAAACTGLLAGAGALWAGGALGDGTLAEVGPPVGWTALAAFGWTFAVAMPTAFLLRWSRLRTPTPTPTLEPKPEWKPRPKLTRRWQWQWEWKARKAAQPVPADASPVAMVLADVTDDVDWGFPEHPEQEPAPGGPALPDAGSARDGEPAPQPGPRPGTGTDTDNGADTTPGQPGQPGQWNPAPAAT
jgi:hypothetical protein